MLTRKEQELLDAIAPKAELENVEIVTIEVVGAKKAPTIRVYIDTDHGVSFDELASAQSWINDIMDEIDPFPGALYARGVVPRHRPAAAYARAFRAVQR